MDQEDLKKELVLRKINQEQWENFINKWIWYIGTWKSWDWVCPHCGWTWYKWRIWVYEIMEYTDEFKDLLIQWKSAYELEKIALKNWMINLERDWIMKTIQWHTTLHEVYRLAKHKEL
jgi:type II secretory ATPase GspE/PulE/Tfp pilus assembly ATPase PilB-like protein